MKPTFPKVNWDSIIREQGIRFKYLRLEDRIMATVCYRITNDKEGQPRVSYGAAFVSSHDTPSKNIGRYISYARLLRIENDSHEYVNLMGTPGHQFKRLSGTAICAGEKALDLDIFYDIIGQWYIDTHNDLYTDICKI